MKIIGRKKEIEIIEECYKSDKSEFIGIFGRRRVGKTFLIREVLGNRITLHSTGIFQGTRNEQLSRFFEAIKKVNPNLKLRKPKNWLEAFDRLQDVLSSLPKGKGQKKVIFLDELPWMDTPKSGSLRP